MLAQRLVLALLLLLPGAAACSPGALECGTGRFCPAGYECVAQLGCCAEPGWLAQVDGGANVIVPETDGGVVPEPVDPETGEPLPPMCGRSS